MSTDYDKFYYRQQITEAKHALKRERTMQKIRGANPARVTKLEATISRASRIIKELTSK